MAEGEASGQGGENAGTGEVAAGNTEAANAAYGGDTGGVNNGGAIGATGETGVGGVGSDSNAGNIAGGGAISGNASFNGELADQGGGSIGGGTGQGGAGAQDAGVAANPANAELMAEIQANVAALQTGPGYGGFSPAALNDGKGADAAGIFGNVAGVTAGSQGALAGIATAAGITGVAGPGGFSGAGVTGVAGGTGVNPGSTAGVPAEVQFGTNNTQFADVYGPGPSAPTSMGGPQGGFTPSEVAAVNAALGSIFGGDGGKGGTAPAASAVNAPPDMMVDASQVNELDLAADHGHGHGDVADDLNDIASNSPNTAVPGTGTFAGVGAGALTVAGGNNPAAAPSNEAPASDGERGAAPAAGGNHGGVSVGQAAASGGGAASQYGAEDANYGGGLSFGDNAGSNGFGDFGSGLNGGNGIEATAALNHAFDMSETAKAIPDNPVFDSIFSAWPTFSPYKTNPAWRFNF